MPDSAVGQSEAWRAALEEICAHAHDEDWWDDRAVCGNPFHTTHQSPDAADERFCPDCFSSWWATDGSLPMDPTYAIEAAARKALRGGDS